MLIVDVITMDARPGCSIVDGAVRSWRASEFDVELSELQPATIARLDLNHENPTRLQQLLTQV